MQYGISLIEIAVNKQSFTAKAVCACREGGEIGTLFHPSRARVCIPPIHVLHDDIHDDIHDLKNLPLLARTLEGNNGLIQYEPSKPLSSITVRFDSPATYPSALSANGRCHHIHSVFPDSPSMRRI